MHGLAFGAGRGSFADLLTLRLTGAARPDDQRRCKRMADLTARTAHLKLGPEAAASLAVARLDRLAVGDRDVEASSPSESATRSGRRAMSATSRRMRHQRSCRPAISGAALHCRASIGGRQLFCGTRVAASGSPFLVERTGRSRQGASSRRRRFWSVAPQEAFWADRRVETGRHNSPGACRPKSFVIGSMAPRCILAESIKRAAALAGR